MQKLKSFLAILLACILYLTVSSQSIFPSPSRDNKLRIEAVKATGQVIIDGKLIEADWNRCVEVKDFIQSQPSQGAKAAFDTKVKVLYDDKYIYIAANCDNRGNKIFVQDLRRDFIYSNNELFGVFLDPFQDIQNPVPSFLTTPYGTQRDLLIYDDRIYDLNWDAVWQAKSFISDSSWSTEIAIPWSTLRYPSDSTTWGINFNRNIRSLNQITGWSPWPFAYTVGRMSYGGLLTNLHPPKNKANIRLQPYGQINLNKSLQQKESIKAQLGGEVKWLLNTSTSIEGTINTDFAQADVDRQVINLKRSSVFFPEKRQFFLENANLFAVGEDGIIQPFFSRRIGLDENGNPLSINSGLRVIHQTGKKAVGALFIRQSDKDTSTHSWFGIMRAQQNIGSKGRAGALATYKYDETSRSANVVLSADGFWHGIEPLYIRPMVSVTLPSGTSKGGWAFFNELNYLKNNFSLRWLETIVTEGYLPKTGFLARDNFINSHAEFTLTKMTHWLNNRIRYFTPSLKADIYHNASNKSFQEANLTIIPLQVATLKGTSFSFSYLPSWQKISIAFNPVPGILIAPGDYNYSQINFNLTTNLSAPFSFIGDVTTGGFYDGKLSSYSGTARFVPIPNIAAALSYTYNRFTAFDTPKDIVTNHLLVPELRVSFNPKIQLSGFYQYNTVNNLGGLNMKFSWEYQPLSFIYLVFNNVRTIDDRLTTERVNDQTGILKLSYIKQL